jgi:hypothetical protein
MENLTPFVYWVGLAVVLILELFRVRNSPKAAPLKETIAYTKRLITNLLPTALLLVTDAENLFGSNTGAIKRSYVIDELYKRIPDEYKKYVTEENLDAIINQVLEKATVFWTENPHIMNH